MALSLYDVTIPVFIRSFNNTAAFLNKAKSHAEEKGTPLSQLLDGRLIEDMKPLTYQIQRMSDTAKGAAARLSGTEIVPMADDEASFDDLQARIAKTLEVLKAVDPGSMDNKLDAEIKLPIPPDGVTFTGKSYVLSFVLPNFYFHQLTAYAILRQMGVPVGKLDFLGSVESLGA